MAATVPLPPTRALRRALERARRARAWVRTGEAVLAAAGALLAVQAAAVLQGARPVEPDVLAVACWTALMVGSARVLEGREDLRERARALDRELRCEGALLAAHDVGERDAGPLDELLAARVLANVRPQRMLRASLTHPWPWLAAPLLGGLCLLQAGDGAEPEGTRGDAGRGRLRELAVAVDQALEEGFRESASGELDADRLQALVDLAAAGRALRGAAPGSTSEAALEAWIQRAGDLAGDLPLASGAALDEALAAAEAAQVAAESARPVGEREEDASGRGPGRATDDPVRPGSPRTTLDPVAAGPDRDGGTTGRSLPGERGRPSTEQPPGPLAAPGERTGPNGVPGGGSTPADGSPGGRGEGTMSDLPEPDGVPPGTSRDEAGLALGRWWTERDAPLVRAWVEARRASR